MNAWKWAWIGAGAAIVLIGSPLYLIDLSHVRVNDGFKAVQDRHAHFARHFPAFLADLQTLKRDPLFANPTGDRNAEELFSRRLSYLYSKQNQLKTPSHAQLRALFQKYSTWRMSSREFKQLAADPALAKIDTTWMDKVVEFDRWDWTSRPDVRQKAALAARSGSLAREVLLPMQISPDFVELKDWAFAHVFRLNREGRAIDGLKILRKVGALAQSSGAYEGHSVAADLLAAEPIFVNGFDIKGWRPVPKESVKAYSRVVQAWVGLVSFAAFDELPKEFEAFLEPRFGACDGGIHFAHRFDDFADFFEPRFPLEPDFSENFARARALQDRLAKICGTEGYEAVLKGIGEPQGRTVAVNAGDNIAYRLQRIPYLRRMAGMKLYLARLPNWASRYESP